MENLNILKDIEIFQQLKPIDFDNNSSTQTQTQDFV